MQQPCQLGKLVQPRLQPQKGVLALTVCTPAPSQICSPMSFAYTDHLECSSEAGNSFKTKRRACLSQRKGGGREDHPCTKQIQCLVWYCFPFCHQRVIPGTHGCLGLHGSERQNQVDTALSSQRGRRASQPGFRVTFISVLLGSLGLPTGSCAFQEVDTLFLRWSPSTRNSTEIPGLLITPPSRTATR